MKTVTLTRTSTSDEGTFGTVEFTVSRFKVSMYSGELPWRDNKQMVSCIPPGIYECLWAFSPHMGRETYLLQKVWGRDFIRIHSANFMGDTKKKRFAEVDGCIALGHILGEMSGQKALLKSREAVASFESYLNKEPFTLEIREAFPAEVG